MRRERRRDDVDLVAGVAHQGAHLGLGGVAPGPDARRPARRGPPRSPRPPGGAPLRPGSRPWAAGAPGASSPSSSPATVCSERHTAGSSATGASCDSAWATAISASSTATHMRRRTRAVAPRLRSSGVARPDVALPAGGQQRQRGQDAAHGDVAVQQPPVPAHVAARRPGRPPPGPPARRGRRSGGTRTRGPRRSRTNATRRESRNIAAVPLKRWSRTEPEGTGGAPPRRRRPVSRPGSPGSPPSASTCPASIFGAALPIGVYFLVRSHVHTDTQALIIAGCFSVGWIVFQFVRQRRVDLVGAIVLSGFAVGVITSTLLGRQRLHAQGPRRLLHRCSSASPASSRSTRTTARPSST